MAESNGSTQVLTAEKLLVHWLGHRALTRKVIEAFPEDKLFTFSVGSMRPFSDLTIEFIHMAAPTVGGISTGEWKQFGENYSDPGKSKSELLRVWDETTAEIKKLWPQIPPKRFTEVDKAFGQWEGENINTLFYIIDNEIHHRGQGYVYLRALGIEPPPFWERE